MPQAIFTDILTTFREKGFIAQLSLEGVPREIEVPMSVGGESWEFTPLLSEQSLRAGAGETIKIRYMGLLHQTLYLVKRTPGATIDRVKSIATLYALGLVTKSPLQVTKKGEGILKKLMYPPQGAKGLLMQVTELLKVHLKHHETSPLRDYLEKEGLIKPNASTIGTPPGRRRNRYYLTTKGTKWLELHCARFMHSKKFDYRWDAIEFLPLEALNEFLADRDPLVRMKARQRAEALQGEATDEK